MLTIEKSSDLEGNEDIFEREGLRVGYRRCSTNKDRQDVGRQLQGVKLDVCVDEYQTATRIDKRPLLQMLMKNMRKGHSLHIQEISRMARNIYDLIAILKVFDEKEVDVEFKSDNLKLNHESTGGITTKLVILSLGISAEIESANRSQAIKQGLKNSNKRSGRASPLYTANKKRNCDTELSPVRHHWNKNKNLIVSCVYNAQQKTHKEIPSYKEIGCEMIAQGVKMMGDEVPIKKIDLKQVQRIVVDYLAIEPFKSRSENRKTKKKEIVQVDCLLPTVEMCE